MDSEAALSQQEDVKQRFLSRKEKPRRLDSDDIMILTTLDDLEDRLNVLYQTFDYVTNPTLIDSCIYEIQSVQMKHKFFLTLCRDRGLVSTQR